MKKTSILLLAMLLAFAGCGKKQKPAETVPAPETAASRDMSQYMPNLVPGSEAPDFEAPDILDNPVRLSDFKGKYVVLDFWATWCKDCRAEVPAMKELYAVYSRRNDVQFLGVSFDTDKQSLLDYCIEKEIPWLQVCNGIKWKENPISIAYDLHWIPTMFLISPEGKVLGIAFTAAELRELLEQQEKERFRQ